MGELVGFQNGSPSSSHPVRLLFVNVRGNNFCCIWKCSWFMHFPWRKARFIYVMRLRHCTCNMWWRFYTFHPTHTLAGSNLQSCSQGCDAKSYWGVRFSSFHANSKRLQMMHPFLLPPLLYCAPYFPDRLSQGQNKCQVFEFLSVSILER